MCGHFIMVARQKQTRNNFTNSLWKGIYNNYFVSGYFPSIFSDVQKIFKHTEEHHKRKYSECAKSMHAWSGDPLHDNGDQGKPLFIVHLGITGRVNGGIGAGGAFYVLDMCGVNSGLA